ncbi:AAA family ATPase [Agromyces sp. NPDC058126]|uniref:AAA family ATPase n=1 Tax=Agromyces sp. NPDC058126 TaxID=3346350 RepID=UPI0036DD2927
MAARPGGSISFAAPTSYYFGGHRFEPSTGLLVSGGVEQRLRPKTAAVLAMLLARDGELVTKADLVDGVWDGSTGDESLAVCVAELRRALGEHPQDARCIATLHRRGYRIITPVATAPLHLDDPSMQPVGRERELAELAEWWARACAGTRVFGFVAGEAGSGKSALVHGFLGRLRAGAHFALGEGRCVDGVGGAPYLPFLDAFAAVCHGPNGARFREILWETAPNWLLLLPGLVGSDAVAELRLRAAEPSPARMLREAADALDAMSAVAPVLLVVEDVHAGDPASLELLAHLAQRPTSARLLVLASYRPDGEQGRGHRLGEVIGALSALRRCELLELPPLDGAAVALLLAARAPAGVPSTGLVDEVLARTEGNALFVTALIDRLIADGLRPDDAGVLHTAVPVDRVEIPVEARRLIAGTVARLDSADRELLTIAAAAGIEFGVDEVVAGLAAFANGSRVEVVPDPDAVARELMRLAEQTGMLAEVEPTARRDGGLGMRFRFAHGLERDALHEGLRGARRVAVHRAIGELLEEAAV